jgi:hypothetical protein
MEVSITQAASSKDNFDIGVGKDAQIAVTVKPAACNGDYTMTITATAGSATGTKVITLTVAGATACGSGLAVAGTGMIANIFGPDTGSYDLVNGVRIPSSGADASKDLKDLSLVGAGFAGTVGSANGTTFVAATAADYTNATAVSVKALAANATLTSISISTVGSVFVAKLGSNRGYAIIKVLTYDATAGASTGANKGEMTFEYKFTAN